MVSHVEGGSVQKQKYDDGNLFENDQRDADHGTPDQGLRVSLDVASMERAGNFRIENGRRSPQLSQLGARRMEIG